MVKKRFVFYFFFSAKRGPALTALPPRLMEMLAKKVMPPVKMLNKVAQEYQLKLIYLKSYCESQLKKSEDSVDVIVEFGNFLFLFFVTTGCRQRTNNSPLENRKGSSAKKIVMNMFSLF